MKNANNQTSFIQKLQETIPISMDLQKILLKTGYIFKHKNSLKYESKRNTTELSNYLWEQKKKKVDV